MKNCLTYYEIKINNMHISFTAHKPSTGTSSFNLIEYLEKENQEISRDENIGTSKVEYFFDSDYSELNTKQKIELSDVVNSIDNNRGTQNLNQSNFYMLNISPSKKELEHMEKIALQELNRRGLDIDSENKVIKEVVEEQKDQLIKMQMKFYVKDVMKEYAENFNRDIWKDESSLPNRKQKKEIEKETEKIYNDFLEKLGYNKEIKKNSKSNKWVEKDNIHIIEEKGKSFLVEIDLKELGKNKVYIPKKMLHEQSKGKYKLPKSIYEEKEKEVINKNILVTVKGDLESTSKLKDQSTVYNFSFKDDRFTEPLKVSFNEKDLQINKLKTFGQYKVSKHLMEAKYKETLNNAIDDKFKETKEQIYKDIVKKKGFNIEKRKLTEKDLLWYGKIETQRTHKGNDKHVIANQRALADGEEPKYKNQNGETVKKGMKKDGLQYHAHVIVSRHDKSMQIPENKISLSPLANQKSGNIHNGAAVGFERDKFFQKTEKVFDTKFNFDRNIEEAYEKLNQNKKERKSKNNSISSVNHQAKGEVKTFLKKHTGINKIKQQISPVRDIKEQLGLSGIPSKIPKSVIHAAYKVTKSIVKKGLGYN